VTQSKSCSRSALPDRRSETPAHRFVAGVTLKLRIVFWAILTRALDQCVPTVPGIPFLREQLNINSPGAREEAIHDDFKLIF